MLIHSPITPLRRKPGRPKGSRNKPKPMLLSPPSTIVHVSYVYTHLLCTSIIWLMTMCSYAYSLHRTYQRKPCMNRHILMWTWKRCELGEIHSLVIYFHEHVCNICSTSMYLQKPISETPMMCTAEPQPSTSYASLQHESSDNVCMMMKPYM